MTSEERANIRLAIDRGGHWTMPGRYAAMHIRTIRRELEFIRETVAGIPLHLTVDQTIDGVNAVLDAVENAISDLELML